MRRVVVTGLGIVSSIGNNRHEVVESLRAGKSGIVFAEDQAERGFRSHVQGSIDINVEEHIDRRLLRFMGAGAAYNYIAMQQAIADAGLTQAEVSHERSGLIMGSGGPSTSNQVEAADIARSKGVKRIGPYMVPRCMSSTNSANMATAFKIKGHSYTISSACSTSAHCIGNGTELIQYGKQDIVFAGGGEELHWTLSMLFDAMGAMSTHFNDTPDRASRAYDRDRDGFVIAERDLKLRGPGEVLGTRQTGMLRFRVADLARDTGLFEPVKALAEQLGTADAECIITRWLGQAEQFVDV